MTSETTTLEELAVLLNGTKSIISNLCTRDDAYVTDMCEVVRAVMQTYDYYGDDYKDKGKFFTVHAMNSSRETVDSISRSVRPGLKRARLLLVMENMVTCIKVAAMKEGE